MTKIIDIGQAKAEAYEKRYNQIQELRRMVHACEITEKSMLDIQRQDRMQFCEMVRRYRRMWEDELAKIWQEQIGV